MTPTESPGFERWIATVTEGLPEKVAAEVRMELQAHFEDAVDDYCARGDTRHAARAAALAELGDARTVRHMLRRVHLPLGARLAAWLRWLAPQLWAYRATIATALFGLLALSFVVADHRHWISYRGHLDPLTPLALAFVVASLVVNRRLAIWSYPAVGYLLAGIWPWLFLELLDGLEGAFWGLIAPMLLPVGTLLTLGVLGLRQLARRGGRRPGSRTCPGIWSGVWVLMALTLATPIAMTGVQLVDGGVAFRPSALSADELAANAPWALFRAAMLLGPVAVGLLGARRDGLAAVLIPLACHYSVFIGIADPTYHLTFYEYWQPTRALHTVEALVTYLPALVTFLIIPFWMQKARSASGRIAATVVPTLGVLSLTHILSALGLQHAPDARNAATWVSAALETLMFVLPTLLALVLYRPFDGDETTSDARHSAPSPAADPASAVLREHPDEEFGGAASKTLRAA
ncbi:MAG: permease prefix domain 1-containing protein [Anaerolineae bacterium]